MTNNEISMNSKWNCFTTILYVGKYIGTMANCLYNIQFIYITWIHTEENKCNDKTPNVGILSMLLYQFKYYSQISDRHSIVL